MIATEEEARAYCAGLTDSAAMARLERLAALVLDENQRQNLISKTSETALWQRHFADSAQLLAHAPVGISPWLDLGTGAGFPGLVVAAMRPEAHCILVESRKKRSEWLARAAAELGLGKCVIEASRLENVAARAVRVVSARAFAPLERLLGLSARFSTRDTVWLLPKGRSAGQEVEALPRQMGQMFHVEQSVTDPAAGIVVGKGIPDVR